MIRVYSAVRNGPLTKTVCAPCFKGFKSYAKYYCIFLCIKKVSKETLSQYKMNSCVINPLPALTYQNVLDLNVACRAKRTQTYWYVRKFKCPLKKRSLPAHAVGI
jgi:hypothetical protein